MTSYDVWLADETPADRGEQPPIDEPDDDVCKTCNGDRVVTYQTDVDDDREYACPACRNGDPDYDRDDG